MKKRKLTWMLALITALMTTACSNDETVADNGGNNDNTITFTVTPDFGVKTRAALDRLPSGKALRCIMAVYENSTGSLVSGSRVTKTVTDESNMEIKFTLEKNLGNAYVVIFWADFTDSASPEADLFYNTADLRKISYNSANTTDFNGEAFNGRVFIDATGVPTSTNITLKHAVSMINLRTTTQLENLQSVKVTYGDAGNANAPVSTFDAALDEPGKDPETVSRTKTVDASQAASDASPYEFNTFYVFARAKQADLINMKIEMCSDNAGTTPIHTIEVPNVPTRANYKTNITGGFAIQPNSFNITCEAEWNSEELTSVIWDGTSGTTANSSYDFNGKAGTENDPYLISSPADLAQLAANVNAGADYNGKFFEMTTDINLGNHAWTPMGNYPNSFKGTFNGNQHKITNLNINSDLQRVGLFGLFQGKLKNLHVSGSVTSTSTISTTDNFGAMAATGGIVGYCTPNTASSDSLLNCSFEGTVTAENGCVGGIAGVTQSITIINCKNSGTISGGIRTGGIAGSTNEGAYIYHSYNTGTVHGKELTGGIDGRVHQGTVGYCYNIGDISSDNDSQAGAIYGAMDSGTITDCYYKTAYAVTSTSGETQFGSSAWPTWKTGTTADGTNENGHWRFLRSGSNDNYPTLWWEKY